MIYHVNSFSSFFITAFYCKICSFSLSIASLFLHPPFLKFDYTFLAFSILIESDLDFKKAELNISVKDHRTIKKKLKKTDIRICNLFAKYLQYTIEEILQLFNVLFSLYFHYKLFFAVFVSFLAPTPELV
jgi:hypothetical protein